MPEKDRNWGTERARETEDRIIILKVPWKYSFTKMGVCVHKVP